MIESKLVEAIFPTHARQDSLSYWDGTARLVMYAAAEQYPGDNVSEFLDAVQDRESLVRLVSDTHAAGIVPEAPTAESESVRAILTTRIRGYRAAQVIEAIFAPPVGDSAAVDDAARQVLTAAAEKYPGTNIAAFLDLIAGAPRARLAGLIAGTDAAVFLIDGRMAYSVCAVLATRIRAYLDAN